MYCDGRIIVSDKRSNLEAIVVEKVRRFIKLSIEKAYKYIESIYEKKLSREKYIKETQYTNFAPTVDDDVARMLQVLITMAKPKKILEIGTSIGFSTVMMAKSVKSYGGKIVTIEIDPEVAKQAIDNFKREGVAEQIEVRIGDARTIILDMNESYDLIFQDCGDKSLYEELLVECTRVLRMGGALVAEDTLFPALDIGSDEGDLSRMCETLDVFNKRVANYAQLESTLLPIGDGMTIAVKK